MTTVPILIQIFVRPEKLKRVFDAVRNAKPQILFLVSDGPRPNYPDDLSLNEECKRMVENIDWECTVYRNYSEVNRGIDITAYEGMKWAFGYVDRLMFLEDDVVPAQSFFTFCEELLERYKDDPRIHSVGGMNHVGNYMDCPYDYFYSKLGSIWGFALWKRSFDMLENDVAFVDDKYSFKLLTSHLPKTFARPIKLNAIRSRNKWLQQKRIGAFELINGAAYHLQNSLIIIPTKNMINCIGISENAGHNVNHPLKLPRSIRKMFYMKVYEQDFPLKHPKYIISDMNYEKLVLKRMGKTSTIRAIRQLESRIRRIIFKILSK